MIGAQDFGNDLTPEQRKALKDIPSMISPAPMAGGQSTISATAAQPMAPPALPQKAPADTRFLGDDEVRNMTRASTATLSDVVDKLDILVGLLNEVGRAIEDLKNS